MIALICLGLIAAGQPEVKPATPLLRAHAHNDYEHRRPLVDALEHGFRSVEADIWLTKDGLLVAHTPLGLDKQKTLQKLYLDPLRERAKANNGQVYPKGPTFFLLIDVKTDAKLTWAELTKVLEQYADILTVSRGDKTEQKAVTVVISGNCDREAITRQTPRYAAIDGHPKDLESDAAAALIPWVSASWSSHSKWDGTGVMPDADRVSLKEYVAKAHQRGRLVRFWAAPDKVEMWRELLKVDVDLINTDKLAELREFLSKEDKR